MIHESLWCAKERDAYAADRSGKRWVPDSTIAKGKRAAVTVADIVSLEEQTDSASASSPPLA